MLGDSLFVVFVELSDVLSTNAQRVVVRGRRPTTMRSNKSVKWWHRWLHPAMMLQPLLLEVPHSADERTSPASSPLRARSTLTAATDRTRTRTSTQEIH